MPDAEIQLIERAYAIAREAGTGVLIERYDEFFTDDFEFRSALAQALEGTTYTGREGFAEYWRQFTDTFEGIEFLDPQIEPVGGEQVLVTTTVRVRGAGGHVPIELEIAHLWKLRDGRIAAGETFTSPRDARERLAG